ncbi:MAG: hypothetical protein BWY09_00702 [Candidatus Hydrogenedentes bacterium ADurb.Bin179]|nr:MAG: hypothetical protein BWY09_00702 [Candidatus Hydrogenedentes bacterium ADurb.Bin179]
MNACFKDGDHFAKNVGIGAFLAAGTGLPGPVRRAVGEILGGGDGVHAAQLRDGAEDVREGVGHPAAHRGLRGA